MGTVWRESIADAEEAIERWRSDVQAEEKRRHMEPSLPVFAYRGTNYMLTIGR